MRRKRIGVLLGGDAPERAVSLADGEAILEALIHAGHDAQALHVDRDLDLTLRQACVEVAFVALHGQAARGAAQGLLESLGIPYTGSSLASVSLASDKLRTKELLRLHNLPTPAYYCHSRGAGRTVDQHGGFGFPCVVKPRSGSCGIGVAVAENAAELGAALDVALHLDEDAIVERFLDGRELQVAILDGEPLGVMEVGAEGILDYATRFSGRAHSSTPRLSPERLQGVVEQAMRAYRLLGCDGLVRVDLLLAARGSESLLEVDVSPDLGKHAIAPRIAEAAGVDFGELVQRMLEGARLHGRRRRRERRSVERAWLSPSVRAPGTATH